MVRQEKGLVIIAVLWICALIMWFSLQISSDSRLRGEEEVHILRRSQALYMAIGGVNEALARMGRSSVGLDEELEDKGWQPNGNPNVVKYETGQAVVVIEEEDKKVSVNALNQSSLKEVLEKAGLESNEAETEANLIIDFLDQDDLPSLEGAEKDDYEQMGLSYRPFDGVMTSLDQLLLIPGITQKLFYGYGEKSAPFEEDEDGELRDIPWPGENSLFQNCTVYGTNTKLPNDEDDLGIDNGSGILGDDETEIVPWVPNGIYRILSSAKSSTGPPSVLLWMIVQYTPGQKPGYQVLYRKIL